MTLQQAADALGVPIEWLGYLIKFESKGNPQAKNPRSTARGLIQWIDATAQGLGYKNSLDLVTKNPTVEQQLDLVVKTLRRYKPFETPTALHMAVFYPAYVHKDINTRFPDHVIKANPGITTPAEYTNYVYGIKKK